MFMHLALVRRRKYKIKKIHHRGHRVKGEKYKTSNYQFSNRVVVFSLCGSRTSVLSVVVLSASC
jgi:hypothetical protein